MVFNSAEAKAPNSQSIFPSFMVQFAVTAEATIADLVLGVVEAVAAVVTGVGVVAAATEASVANPDGVGVALG